MKARAPYKPTEHIHAWKYVNIISYTSQNNMDNIRSEHFMALYDV